MVVVVGGKCPTPCKNGKGIVRVGEMSAGNMSEGGNVYGDVLHSFTQRTSDCRAIRKCLTWAQKLTDRQLSLRTDYTENVKHSCTKDPQASASALHVCIPSINVY